MTIVRAMRVIRFPHGCYTKPMCIPLDTPGIIGDIARAMNTPDNYERKKKQFVRPYDWEFIAQKMPEAEREAYTAQCLSCEFKLEKEIEKRIEIEYDRSVVMAVYDKYKKKMTRPPCDELVDAYVRAGASEARIEKVKYRYKKWKDDAEKQQSAIDKVFSKYPSALKPTKEPSKKKKVIRAVKKKMNIDK